MAITERRVFEGVIGREDELHSQDAYLIAPGRCIYWQEWIRGLDGRRVRVTVETIDGEGR